MRNTLRDAGVIGLMVLVQWTSCQDAEVLHGQVERANRRIYHFLIIHQSQVLSHGFFHDAVERQVEGI